MNQRKALFLDRDGIINQDIGYLHRIDQCEFVPNIFNLCHWFSDNGYDLVVVTNQSGIARGYYTEDDFHHLMTWMSNQFKRNGLMLLDVFFCPHHPEKGIEPYKIDCLCRKPKPGMFKDAARKHDINLAESWMIGDSLRDIESAQSAGVARQILLSSTPLSVESTVSPTYQVSTLNDCLTLLVEFTNNKE